MTRLTNFITVHYMLIDLSKIRAFIFDNDGVIVNSEPLSCGALRELLKLEYNIDIGNDFSKVIGTSDKYAITYYLKQHNIDPPDDLGELIEKKSEIYFEIAKDRLETFEGFHELLSFLQDNYELAVASSGNHDKIKFSLEEVNASKYFPIICSATEVERGKPAPDLFKFTAECLGINEENCVVVEDSVKGIQGAKTAGMQVIAITTSFDEKVLKEAGADLIVENFSQLLKKINQKRT